MSTELSLDDRTPPLQFGSNQEKFFKIAIGFSVLMHVLGLLTSPWWQPAPMPRDQVMQVDIANVPAQELPTPKEAAPIKLPDAVKPAPPPPPKPTAEQMQEFQKQQAVDPAVAAQQAAERAAQAAQKEREDARAKVRNVGLGAVLDKSGGTGPVPVNVPTSSRVSDGKVGKMDYGAARGRDGADPLEGRGMTPDIQKQLASARSGKGGGGGALSSKVFKTDTGMDAEISGSLDDKSRSAQAIMATVKNYQSGIKYAYTKELLNNQSINGKITVEFVILSDGSVESVVIKQSTVNWPPLEDAIKKRISRLWNFGPSKGGPVKVAFPFVFNPEM
jgi:TonB family protein